MTNAPPPLSHQSRSSWSFRLLAFLLPLIVAGSTLSARAPASLASQIEEILDTEDVRAAFWGVYVQDLGSGEVLYSRNADRTLVPASNQKLITTAVALDALGPHYRYQTTLYFDGEVDGTVLRGDLILKGSGDPTFGSMEIAGPDPLRTWARRLASMGVTRIEGRIIGDDDAFDEDQYLEGWDVAFIATESFAPARGGLSYRDNVIDIKVDAARPGARPRLTVDPPGYLDIRNEVTTSSRRRARYPQFDRQVGTERVRLYGTAPLGYRATIQLPVSDPTAFTLHAFAHCLREAGIESDVVLRDVDELDAKPDYERARPLFVYASPPLKEIIAVINKESQNFYAEQLFSTLGWGGTAASGSRRVRDVLSRFGITTRDLSIRDGSGLSRKDMLTPRALGQLLAYMYEHPERDVFMASLPRAGERETTLRYRLNGLPVLAKTGSLEYVRTLSGYVVNPDRPPIVFAIMVNNYTGSSYRVTKSIDDIVHVLATAPPG